ncbi:MAG: phosphoglycerate kinase [Chloroflexota bacterium]
MKRSIRDVDVSGKTVLVRVDYNVPLGADGRVADASRIVATLPTLRLLRERGATVVLMAHFGRPKGERRPEMSLAPVARELSSQLGIPVTMAEDCVGPQAWEAVRRLRRGDVCLLENLRFHAEEEKNDPDFARKLAALADLYVNDAFGTAHRAHASTVGVCAFLPAYAGLLMEKEVSALGGLLSEPRRPFVAIVGGAKVSTKLAVLESMLERVNVLLIGGGMANTFLRARGLKVGASLLEADLVETAAGLLDKATARGVELLLPTDVVVAEAVREGADARTVGVDAVPDGWAIVDIGAATAARYDSVVGAAGTVLWNGPMGVFEIAAFGAGTRAVAESLARSGATTVIGGGESVAAVEQLGLTDKMTHISTGGGATLEFLEGRELPGVAALADV